MLQRLVVQSHPQALHAPFAGGEVVGNRLVQAGGIAGIEKKLANENFVSRAPAEVVQRERDRLSELQAELAQVRASLSTMRRRRRRFGPAVSLTSPPPPNSRRNRASTFDDFPVTLHSG